MEAPDRSFRVTDDQAAAACELYHFFGWDLLEKSIPAGATDTTGAPLDRNNRNLQLVAMSMCLADVRGDEPQRGWDRLGDPHWHTFISCLLDAYHKTIKPILEET
jgi:hypothetical protein